MMDPIVLPPADCIISAWLLDVISKDQDDNIRYLKKVAGLLKLGGHMILLGDLNTTYYTIGKRKFHILNYDDEEFVRKALVEAGFVLTIHRMGDNDDEEAEEQEVIDCATGSTTHFLQHGWDEEE
ncbi:unnamed protein product [Ranitomeya imitator]|uniref:Uncharacterized protein n=1 Tax=Ranitomeya imitator TaxID=111125 RepID=A0ABN9MLP3_9NEOB|nr:unnamed protein product [Ranitomeya imitator]